MPDSAAMSLKSSAVPEADGAHTARSAAQHATSARVWYSPDVARWEVEKGATPLVDGAALSERAVGSAEWLIGEVLSFRGEAAVLEPAELRERVAARARELQQALRRTPAKNAL